MLGNLSGWHLLILLAVILLLFGAPKLPGLARSLGQSMRIFRSEVRTMKSESESDGSADASTTTSDTAAEKPVVKPAADAPTRDSTPPKP